MVRRYLEDAAHYPGGHAAGVARPATVDEVPASVRQRRVRPSRRRAVVADRRRHAGRRCRSQHRAAHRHSRLTAIASWRRRRHAADAAAGARGAWRCGCRRCRPFSAPPSAAPCRPTPPARRPSSTGRSARWVEALTVVLATGDVLRVGAGEVPASDDGTFVVATSGGDRDDPLPQHSHAGCAEAFGRLSRRARHGPRRSVHRRGRHARRDRRGGAARAAAAGGRLLALVPLASESAAIALAASAARRGA